ncbi:response regulator transcription factor [Sphingosinicella sp. CPCC 101087]|uniref:LuxR C-terminal-related transcriptional regulator n=1 Tax=Sphingosinicella sp. CPCC 101087 TaxID=2497754 RepID=UPI00101E0B43|nr:response regulator transcription factor [Sphingosinicella sp. CPCC 101087]
MSLLDPDASARNEVSGASKPRVVIISNVLLYREGLAASLTKDGRLEVASALGSGSALAAIQAIGPDAVLLDASTSGALILARQVRACCPSARLVGFGIAGGADAFLACAEAGVAAFVDSNGTVSELVAAVEGALRGELRCSPQVTALLCDRLASLADTRDSSAETLTRREREIAVLVAQGLSNKEIASDLNIGPATVKNHVHNILDKLKVRRRAAIAAHLTRPAPNGAKGPAECRPA